MKIEKYWIDKKSNGDNIVLINNEKIFKKKFKSYDLQKVELEIKKGIINSNFLSIPYHYISSIELQETSNKLVIKRGKKDANDEITITNSDIRTEIFEYLKVNSPVKDYKEETPSVLKSIKKPLIALCVVLVIFSYVYYFIWSMNQGYVFELKRGRPGLGAIALMLAELGLLKNILIFSSLSFVAFNKIRINLKNRSLVKTIVY